MHQVDVRRHTERALEGTAEWPLLKPTRRARSSMSTLRAGWYRYGLDSLCLPSCQATAKDLARGVSRARTMVQTELDCPQKGNRARNPCLVISPSPFNAAQAASTSCAATTAKSPELCLNMTYSIRSSYTRKCAARYSPRAVDYVSIKCCLQLPLSGSSHSATHNSAQNARAATAALSALTGQRFTAGPQLVGRKAVRPASSP